MQGEPLDSETSLITLVDSVALPLIDQLNVPIYHVTDSTENFVFINELRVTEFVYLFSRLVNQTYLCIIFIRLNTAELPTCLHNFCFDSFFFVGFSTNTFYNSVKLELLSWLIIL